MNIPFTFNLPNGTSKPLLDVTDALRQKPATGATGTFPQPSQDDLELNILTAERGAAFLDGILPVIDVQPAQSLPTMGLAIRSFAKVLGAQVELLLSFRNLGLLLTTEQARRLEEVGEDVSEVLDSLSWTLDAKDELQSIIRDECA